MKKGKYLIDVSVWKQIGKSRRKARVLEEREGYIDTKNNLAYSTNEFGDCRVTDIKTGLSVYNYYGKSLDDCIEKYEKDILEAINKARSQYYYDGAVKLFEYLETCTEPVTEQKLTRIFA